MQIIPDAGKEPGARDFTVLEPDIRGGARYMDQLMTHCFKDANFSDPERSPLQAATPARQRREDAQRRGRARPRSRDMKRHARAARK